MKRKLLALVFTTGVTLVPFIPAQAENLNFLVQPIRAKLGDIVVGARGDVSLSLGSGGDLAAVLQEKGLFDEDIGFKREGYLEAFASKVPSQGSKLLAALGLHIDNADTGIPDLNNVRARVEFQSPAVDVAVGHLERTIEKSFELNPALVGKSSLTNSKSRDFVDDLGISLERRLGRWDARIMANADASVRAQLSTDRVINHTFGWFGGEVAYDDVRRLSYNSGVLESSFKRGLELAAVGDLAYGSTKFRGRAEVSYVLDDAESGLATDIGAGVSHKFDRLALSVGAKNKRDYTEETRELVATIGATYDIGTNLKAVAGATFTQARDLSGGSILGEAIENEFTAEAGLNFSF